MLTDYIRADSVSEAVQTLNASWPRGRLLAGGTDILPKAMALRRTETDPVVFIDIKRIEELKGIRIEGDWLVIGATATLYDLIESTAIQNRAPILAQAAIEVGSNEIRIRATAGGNIGTKNSNADLLVPLIGLGARVAVADLTGPSELTLQELLGPGRGRLGRSMIITALKVPVADSASYGYQRWSRESMGRAYLSVMASLTGGMAAETYALTVVTGGIGLWPRRLDQTTSLASLADPDLRAVLIQGVVRERFSNAPPNEYKRQLMSVLIDDALTIARKGVRP